jgi:hypothetical protein
MTLSALGDYEALQGVLCDPHSLWLVLEAVDIVTQPLWDLGMQDYECTNGRTYFCLPLELVRPLEPTFETYSS